MPTISVTFSYDCAPFYNAVHDPIIALKTMRRKRTMCLFIGCLEHVWGHPWSWEFSPTRCLLFAYAEKLLYFRILAMYTSRLETLQKRKRNSSIGICFSAKQLLSSNFLCFFGQRKFRMPHRATLIEPFNLNPQAAKFVESAVAYAASAAKGSKICLRQPTHPNKLPTSNHVQVNFHINLYL